MLLVASVVAFVACSGGEAPKSEPPPTPPAPKVVAPPPAPVAPAAEGPYTPDDLAKAAYEKAKAAGADSMENPKVGVAESIAAGKAIYDTKCTTCHGATGKGDGIAGAALPQKPAQFHWKERWDTTSIGAKHWVILNGVQGTAMAPLGVDENQAWEVLAYIQNDFAPKAVAP